MYSFPRTTVGGVSLPRMIVGTNWILGYSHTGAAADAMIKRTHHSPESITAMLLAALENGVDAMMAPFGGNTVLLDAIHRAEEIAEKKVILIDTPNIDVSDSKEGREKAWAKIEESRKNGATFCLIHHAAAEQLVDKHAGTLRRIDDYTSMIREAGMIPGLSAHMPELILYSDRNGYDVETYIQLYNCMGFLMQVEVEYINQVIWNAKKPVMTIKSMAAGRCSPFVGISFAYNTIRPCDMVTMGAFNPDEVHEDVEIALAAIEHRRANIGGRATPNKTAALGGKVK